MKKIYTYTMLLAMSSVTFLSCGSSKESTKGIFGDSSTIGGTVVKTVATIVGAIVLSKIINSIFKTVGTSSSFSSLTNNPSFAAGFNENTKLSSLASNDFMKTALQVIVAEKYKIPLTTVATNFRSLTTVGDLATFIGKNADAKVLNEIK